MSGRQLAALWVGIAAAGALLLFPPHVMMPNTVDLLKQQFGLPGGHPLVLVRYAFVFAPPPGSVGIDWQRLWIPVAVVGLVTLGAVLSLGTRRPGVVSAP